jgi:hypothetical protein
MLTASCATPILQATAVGETDPQQSGTTNLSIDGKDYLPEYDSGLG